MTLDFEIAVDQQTKARDRTFERDSHAHIWSNFGSILPNHLNMPKTMLCSYKAPEHIYKVLSKLDKN